MELPTDRPIDLYRLGSVSLSFVDLKYLHMPPEASLFDAAYDDFREDALHKYLNCLEDEGDDVTLTVRRSLAWLLNLSPERFEVVVRQIKIPYPHYWDFVEIHRFLELLWTRAWPDSWRVPNFDPDKYELITRWS